MDGRMANEWKLTIYRLNDCETRCKTTKTTAGASSQAKSATASLPQRVAKRQKSWSRQNDYHLASELPWTPISIYHSRATNRTREATCAHKHVSDDFLRHTLQNESFRTVSTSTFTSLRWDFVLLLLLPFSTIKTTHSRLLLFILRARRFSTLGPGLCFFSTGALHSTGVIHIGLGSWMKISHYTYIISFF